MLTTRCPNCQTTFRITSVALHKAAGQVRCGQCSSVFSAFDSLTDTLTGISATDAPLESTITEPQAQESSATQSPDVQPPAADSPDNAATAEHAPAPLPDARVEEVLEDAPPPRTPWRPRAREPQPESRWWRIAAAVAALALLVQGAHHFRVALAHVPLLGSGIERLYALAGSPIQAPVDPASFAIVNWVATAQSPDSADTSDTAETAAGSLAISAGVRNTSNVPLPYPMLSLELTDRWEETIAARVFTPEEYMGSRLSSNARIRPNSTVTAQLQLVDPGPDAYGFEVDICVPIDAERMRCKQTVDPFR